MEQQQDDGNNKQSKQAPETEDFQALDEGFIRVLEDVVDALLSNGTLRMTDLPVQAQEKISQRKQYRQRLRNSLDLLPDDDLLI